MAITQKFRSLKQRSIWKFQRSLFVNKNGFEIMQSWCKCSIVNWGSSSFTKKFVLRAQAYPMHKMVVCLTLRISKVGILFVMHKLSFTFELWRQKSKNSRDLLTAKILIYWTSHDYTIRMGKWWLKITYDLQSSFYLLFN